MQNQLPPPRANAGAAAVKRVATALAALIRPERYDRLFQEPDEEGQIYDRLQTVQAIVDATKGQRKRAKVHDPLGRPIWAKYGITGAGKTAVLEMAAPKIPTITIRARTSGMKGWERRAGVA